jgi:uncharacterized protein (TIGR03437 family)
MFKPLFALLGCLVIHQAIAAQIPPITAGYGAQGNYSVSAERFASPLFQSENVHVFRPNEASAPVPVLFFAPGFGNNDPASYRPLINHLVSRGYAVVFSPFQIIAPGESIYSRRYDTIWAGYEEAVRRYGQSFDLTRVGFIGHSFGGGASFAMMQRGAVGRGWGRNGLCLFVMAPWYVYEITTKQLVDFPAHAKLIVQVYEADEVCDHRIAKEVFERANLPASEKEFVLLRSDAWNNVELNASHGTPSGQTPNGLDYYGIWRLLDALADYAFTGNLQGKQLALGKDSAQQRFMGQWPDGKPVKELLAGECVPVTRPTSSFLFPYDQTIHQLSAVSAASFKAPLAPEAITSLFGKELAATAASNTTLPLPTKLNGASIKVRDSACVERPAPLFFVSPTQINFLLPADTAQGAATVIAYNEAGAVSLGTLNVNSVAPGLFAANADGQGVAAAVVLKLKPDGTQQFEPVARFDTAQNRFIATPIDLSDNSGTAFLILYGTGLRYRSSLAAVTATLGGVNAEVLYADAQGQFAGLDQVNLRLPQTLAGRGEVEVVLRVDGQVSNTVRLRVK